MIKRLLTMLKNRRDLNHGGEPAVQFNHASAPPGTRLMAIGDVHGRLDLLQRLIERLEAECSTGTPAENHLVMLGDYIDRGPHSAATIEWLSCFSPNWSQVHFLRGNHEQSMLDVLNGTATPETTEAWLMYGGVETLASYGVGAPIVYSGDLERIQDAFRTAVPQHHLRFLEETRLKIQFGDYLFVHAGARPGVPLAKQRESDLLWIREPFLSCDDDFGFVVVHGHSISPTVENRRNRIGIDTGAYATGELTAVILEGQSRRFISASLAEQD